MTAQKSAKMIRNRLFFCLAACACSLGLSYAQVATFAEADVPRPLVLKPGITQITGGITLPDQQDRFYFRPTVGGTLIVRLNYEQRNGNVISGISELPHLNGSLVNGSFLGANFTASGSPVALTSPFFIQNAQNTIRVNQTFGDNTQSSGYELVISAPAGKTHPNYTIELDYQPMADSFEGTSGNNSLANAVLLDASIFGDISGNVLGSADSDWFRFDVPAGRMLRVSLGIRNLTPFSSPPQYSILNAQGIPLQASDQFTFLSFTETADGNGDTYYVRIAGQNDFAEGWTLRWLLEDSFDPNETLSEASQLGTLTDNTRIDHRNLVVAPFATDHYTFDVDLSPGKKILIATLPDPAVSQIGDPFPQIIESGGFSVENYGNYIELFDSGAGPVSIQVNTATPARYRLLIKPFSAYDEWQLNESLLRFSQPVYYLPGDSDFDQDGVPASLEFALRRSPFTATTSSVSAPYLDGSLWKINVAMPPGGSRAPILIEESINLNQWTDLPSDRGNFGGAFIPQGRTSGAVITLSRPGEPKNFIRFGAAD